MLRCFYVFILLITSTFIGNNVYADPISPPKPLMSSAKQTIPDLSHYKRVEYNRWLYGLSPFTVGPWQIETGDWGIVSHGGNGVISVSGIRFRTPTGTRCMIIDWIGPRCVKYVFAKIGEDASHEVQPNLLVTGAGHNGETHKKRLHTIKNSSVAISCEEAKIQFILFHNERTPGTISTLPHQRCDAVYHPKNIPLYDDHYSVISVGYKISAYNITCAVAEEDRITCMNSFHHGFVFATGHDQTF